MARTHETVQFVAAIMIVVQNMTHLVECEDKRIVIFVPRRIKTVHHHHHHVVLMDPKTKTMTHTKPYSDKSSLTSSVSSSSAEVDYQQQQRDRHRHYQRQQKQQKQQSEEAESHPLSYFQQRTTVRTGDPNNVYPVPQMQPAVMHLPLQTYPSWPPRQKRSKVLARLVYTRD